MNTLNNELNDYLSERDKILIDLYVVNNELEKSSIPSTIIEEYFYGDKEKTKEEGQEFFKIKNKYSHIIVMKNRKIYIDLLEV
jgi:hypothetical protein